jgi:pimeloyl-ACP methyl ester carboxylesterase
MDGLEERHIDAARGLHYRYYTTSNNTPVSPSSPALLLTHGFPDDAQLWQFVVPHLLATKLKLIVPDLLGYGGTSKPEDPQAFEISAMCQDVVEILDQEGVSGENSVIPVGHDWGAYYAQRFYMLHTSLCAGLVTMSVAIFPPARDKFDLEATNKFTEEVLGYPLFAYWELFLPHEGVKLIDSRLESFWYALHGDEPNWMREMFCVKGAMKKFLEENRQDIPLKPHGKDEKLKAQWMASHDPARGGSGLLSPTNWYRALAQDIQLPAELKLSPKVEKPYLFIGLLQDAVNRADAIEQAKKEGWCKDLTVREIDSGHWVPYEKPDDVGKAVVEWLNAKGFVKE